MPDPSDRERPDRGRERAVRGCGTDRSDRRARFRLPEGGRRRGRRARAGRLPQRQSVPEDARIGPVPPTRAEGHLRTPRDPSDPARRRADRARRGQRPRRAAAQRGRLPRAGIRIAADDVGAGNAGLRLLSEIQFDIVKIDLSLVQGGILHDPSHAVLRAIQELASRWQATTVAEGVETAEQLAAIRGLGITTGQGYLLGRPARDRR